MRRARPDDLDVLVELNAEYSRSDGHVVDPNTARAGFAPLLTDDRHGMVWLVTVAHEPAEPAPDGYAVVTWGWSVEAGGAEAVLDEIYVRTRDRGIGSRALAVAIEACERAGVRRIFLETERANEAARRLYRRHGFVDDDSIWLSRWLRPPGDSTATPRSAPVQNPGNGED